MYGTEDSAHDKYHCLRRLNHLAVHYNKHLKMEIEKLSIENPNIKIVYGDLYNAFEWLLSRAPYLGLHTDNLNYNYFLITMYWMIRWDVTILLVINRFWWKFIAESLLRSWGEIQCRRIQQILWIARSSSVFESKRTPELGWDSSNTSSKQVFVNLAHKWHFTKAGVSSLIYY